MTFKNLVVYSLAPFNFWIVGSACGHEIQILTSQDSGFWCKSYGKSFFSRLEDLLLTCAGLRGRFSRGVFH